MLQSSLAALQIIPEGSRVEVFQRIYWVFLALGTLVGGVVIGYMVYNAYKYRDDGGEDAVEDRPQLGELPTGGGKGGKLFLSFALSAIIVVSLIVWTYGTLLYVENAAASDTGIEGEDPVEIRVEGYQFGWRYYYPNGNQTDTLYIPADRTVQIRVTSADVWHNYGIPDFRVKSDAIPGQWTDTWFIAEETGEYTAKCYELCGSGHSYMEGTVVVMTDEEFQEWYDDRTAEPESDAPCPPDSDALDCPDEEGDGGGGDGHGGTAGGEEADHDGGAGSESITTPTGDALTGGPA